MATFNGGSGRDTYVGGPDDDTINGNYGRDTLSGGGGNDTINGGGGDDILHGDDGNDTIDGGKGNDLIYGDAGNDVLIGGLGDDHIYGGDGNDTITDGSGILSVHADAGDDTFTFGGGQITGLLDGGTGTDTLTSYYSADISKATVTGWERLGVGNGSVTATANQFNAFSEVFGAWDQNIVLNVAPSAQPSDTFTLDFSSKIATNYFLSIGANSQDSIIGHDGADYLLGGNSQQGLGGNDLLSGAVSMSGGEGDDRFLVDPYGGGVVRTIDGGPGYDSLVQLENITAIAITNVEQWLVYPSGTATVEQLRGFSDIRSADTSHLSNPVELDLADAGAISFGLRVQQPVHLTVHASEGGNIIMGHAGVDNLYGGNGADTLDGLSGRDQISGGGGNDIIDGGGGQDTLTGGAGADHFVFSKLQYSTVAAPDTITDMTSSDLIDLSAIDADTTLGGDQAFTLVSAFGHHAGEAVLSPITGGATLSLDVNGDGVADSAITIMGDVSNTAIWIL